MDISKQHYKIWNSFTDEKLEAQFLHITRYSQKSNLKFTMDALMKDRGLKIFDDEIVNAEFEKAMQVHYVKDSELLDRAYEVLYGNN